MQKITLPLLNAAAEGSTQYASGSSYTVDLLDYDASVFVLKQEVTSKMDYIQCKDASSTPILGQNVTLEKGKTYKVSFRSIFVTGDLNTTAILRVKAQLGSGKYTMYYGSTETGDKAMKADIDKGCLLGELHVYNGAGQRDIRRGVSVYRKDRDVFGGFQPL